MSAMECDVELVCGAAAAYAEYTVQDEEHAAAIRQAITRVLALCDADTRPTVDQTLLALEDAMHRHCDQPLSVDAMSLTREWRGILERFAATRLCEWCGERPAVSPSPFCSRNCQQVARDHATPREMPSPSKLGSP